MIRLRRRLRSLGPVWRRRFCSLSPAWRARARAIDVDVLFPLLWERAGQIEPHVLWLLNTQLTDTSRSPRARAYAFITAACLHTATDPAWRVWHEWQGTEQDPGRWAAARVNA